LRAQGLRNQTHESVTQIPRCHTTKTRTKANWLEGKIWIPIQLTFERLGRITIERRTRSRIGTSKRRNAEDLCFGVSRHVTCVTRCKEWYSTTHTAARTQRAHSTSHPVHCNIVPHQATPFINPTYANFIQNPKTHQTVTTRYVTSHDATHSTQTDTATLLAPTHVAPTQGDGERRKEVGRGR
jgi:hypothetical protein